MQHGLRKHAKYGMSSLYRYSVCFGSVKLAEVAPPQPETSYARDGTEAHELLDFALKNGHWSALSASIAANRYDFDTRPECGERFDAVQMCLDYVLSILEAYDDAVLYVEHPFEFPSTVTDEAWGTCDICIHIPSFDLVYVIDYKHGAGEAVDVFSTRQGPNKQAMGYGTGAVVGSGHLDASMIMLAIVQPRAFHPLGAIREHAVFKSDLQAFVAKVDGWIERCEAPDAPLVPYDGKNNDRDHCKWCPANLTCKAREAKVLGSLANTFSSVKDVTITQMAQPEAVTMDRVAYVLAAKPFVMQWFNDYENYAYNALMNGNHVPGQKLVESQSRRQWDGDPTELAQQLLALADLNPAVAEDWDKVYPRKLITITDATKIVGDAFKAKVKRGHKKQAAEDANKALAALTIKESSGNLVMVDVTDSRPAADRATIAFKNVVAIPPSPNAPKQG